MEFYFKAITIEGNKILPLSESEFCAIKNAKESLTELYRYTENYLVVVESYRKLEIAKFEAELDHVLYASVNTIDNAYVRIGLNSPISGYLSCSRFFIERSESIIRRLLSEVEADKYDKLRSELYDGHLGYRFIEALRNFVQHGELPIDIVSFRNFLEPEKTIKDAELVTCMSLFATKSWLASGNFKKKVLDELPGQIDIIHSIRIHMAGVWELYNLFSEQLNTTAKDWQQILETFIDKFRTEKSQNFSALYAIKSDPNGNESEKIPMVLEWDNARKEMLKKIMGLRSLGKRYITGQIQVNRS